MTDEERRRAMDFIVEQSAKNAVGIEQLIESHRRAVLRLDGHDHRLDRYERILKLMIEAGRRARHQLREQDELWKRQHAELVESGKHTDRRLDALIDIVRADRNGRSSPS
jgi:hypothetical protein